MEADILVETFIYQKERERETEIENFFLNIQLIIMIRIISQYAKNGERKIIIRN